MNNGWITDRLPREEDGSIWIIGQVWISGVDGVYTTHWSEVNKGQPWQPILAPAPYVKSKSSKVPPPPPPPFSEMVTNSTIIIREGENQ